MNSLQWPAGTQFMYLGLRLVVLRHVDASEAEHTFNEQGLLCHYVDFHGGLREVTFPDNQIAAVQMVATPGWDS